MSVVTLAMAWFISVGDASKLAHYRSLSHDALISQLASENDGKLTTDIPGAVFLVLVVVIGVDVLTRLFESLWARFGRSPRAPTFPSTGGPAT